VGSAGNALAFVDAARANGDNLAALRLLPRRLRMKTPPRIGSVSSSDRTTTRFISGPILIATRASWPDECVGDWTPSGPFLGATGH